MSCRRRFRRSTPWEDEMGAHGPFDVGDVILYGKYKNKRGKIIAFGTNPKGQVTVEVEPIPKGRKKNRVMGLYKIWTLPQAPAEAVSSGAAMSLQHLINEAREALGTLDEETLDEVAAKRTRRRQAGKGTKKTTRKCPTGHHMKGGRCVRVPTSKLRKKARLKKKWAKRGAGKKSAKRSARFKKRWN
jgi:hypothetical protein